MLQNPKEVVDKEEDKEDKNRVLNILMMIKPIFKNAFLALIMCCIGFTACSDDSNTIPSDDDGVVISVDVNNFASSVTITTVDCTLSDGTSAKCYKIVTNSTPSDHEMGPWCPTNISDDDTKGGIWLSDGTVYDVDGEFIKNLATFYNDNTWMMYNSTTGEITVTETEEDCTNAANPNVGEEYKNYCVECLPSYITSVSQAWLIPITPVAQSNITFFNTAGGPPEQSNVPSTRGVALNGVEFSAPAPVSNILGAYTLAPFDDAGGHINVHQGYHYHAVMGLSTQVEQSDGHAPLIGYAMDGYGIYANTDVSGNEAPDLDAARGHYDGTRGYHYHTDKAGSNNFIDGLKGAYAVE